MLEEGPKAHLNRKIVEVSNHRHFEPLFVLKVLARKNKTKFQQQGVAGRKKTTRASKGKEPQTEQ